MSTASALASKIVEKGHPDYDPNRTLTLNVKASEAYMIRYIAAILADEKCDDEGRKSLLRNCGGTPADMMRIHHKVYSAEMGWGYRELDR
jgi:hypothetical protein